MSSTRLLASRTTAKASVSSSSKVATAYQGCQLSLDVLEIQMFAHKVARQSVEQYPLPGH